MSVFIQGAERKQSNHERVFCFTMRKLALIVPCLWSMLLITLAPAITAAEPKEPISISAEVRAGYGYDSNVVIDDVDLATRQSDQFVDIGLTGSFRYEAPEGTDYLLNGSVSEKLYSSFDEFNGRLAVLTAAVEKEVGKATIGLNLRHIDYHLNGESFLKMDQISPTISWFPGKRTYLRIAYTIGSESFADSDERGNDQHQLDLTGYFFLRGLRRYMTLSLQGTSEEADVGYFDNNTRVLRVTYQDEINLLDKVSRLKVEVRREERVYDGLPGPFLGEPLPNERLFNEKRRDARNLLQFEWTFPINKLVDLSAEASIADNKSNQATADYGRRYFQLTFRYKLAPAE